MTSGQIAAERFAFSMPVDAPLYPPPPWHYTDAEFVTVSYETDEAAARAVLPAALDLRTPATVRMTFARYPNSPVGPYNEAIQSVECAFNGRNYGFISRILLDNDGAIAAGREVWGYPKKSAVVNIGRNGDDVTAWVERPAGQRLASARLRLKERLPVAGASAPGATVNVRLIPNTEPGPPSVCELVEVMLTLTAREAWSATGEIDFGAPSEADPWAALPVRRVTGATYTVVDMELPHGRVLARL